jgi:hypothetical protein
MSKWFSKPSKNDTPDQQEIALKWVSDYGIHQAIDAEDASEVTPVDLDWDMNRVWTAWDTYDVVAVYVEPGYSEKEDDGNRFVTSWYLGTEVIHSAADVEILGREVCSSCDTVGCEKCDELGWYETDFLASVALKIKWVSDEAVASPLFCGHCGFKFGDAPAYCGGCGIKVG